VLGLKWEKEKSQKGKDYSSRNVKNGRNVWGSEKKKKRQNTAQDSKSVERKAKRLYGQSRQNSEN